MIGRGDPWFTGSKPPWYRRPIPLATVIGIAVAVVLVLLGNA
jgi:hypothetical protein